MQSVGSIVLLTVLGLWCCSALDAATPWCDNSTHVYIPSRAFESASYPAAMEIINLTVVCPDGYFPLDNIRDPFEV